MTIRRVPDGDTAWGDSIRALIDRVNDLGDTVGSVIPANRLGSSSGGTTNFLRADGTFATPVAQATVSLRTVTGTTDTLVVADAGKGLLWTNSADGTQTVPPNSSVAFPIGTVIEVTALGGQVTLAPGTGVTLDAPRGLKTANQFSTLKLLKIATNEWVISGDAAQATSPGIPFLTRIGPSLFNGPTRFRFFGVNAYWLALNDNARDGSNNPTYPASSVVDATFQAMNNMGATLARVHTLGISVGNAKTMMPTLGNWDANAVDKADYVIKSAKDHNIRLMVPLVDRWNFYHGGGLSFAGFRGGSDMNFFYTNSQVRTDFKAYISTLLNHVNPYTGLAWKNDPTIAIWETGNEIYDAPLTWTSDIAAYVKSIAPSQLVADGTAASGMHVSNSAITDTNIDVMGTHFYDDHSMDRSWLRTDAAAAVAANKAYVVGEYDWTDGSNNGTTTATSDATRAQWLSEMETNGNVTGGIMWAIVHTSAGVHRDGYELYVPSTENSEQAAGLTAFTAHGPAMAASTATPTDYTGTVTDDFTGTNGAAVDGGKWVFLESPTNGAGVADIQSNRGRMLTAPVGSYGSKIALISQASARASTTISATLYPQDLSKESYFAGIVRGSTADLSVGDVNCYRFEIATASGAASVSVAKKVSSTQTVFSGSSSTISGAANTQPIYVEFSAVGTTLTLRAWTGNKVTNRPSTPTWTGTDSSITAAGRAAFVLNGGAAATTVDWRIDDTTVS